MKLLFQCLYCDPYYLSIGNGLYETPEEAQQCELTAQTKERLKPGDIVIGPDKYGWYDGDPTWIASHRPDEATASGQRYRFYYVVTAVTRDRRSPHRPFWHLVTLALQYNSKSAVYTTDEGHIWIDKVVPLAPPNPQLPQTILDAIPGLLGMEARRGALL